VTEQYSNFVSVCIA